ncbi:helix-turn-helix domain-containing protein [Lacticaseibacillus zhaodongensis]|uniref:helix-turn-helix domain-containing protein n=1 Tax=Lacticaseibacillus zhaodongensis TaxID=2668065 RepID=UPI0012D2D54C|nr:helix-turn-helix transcriptional regulator [Lacticaseibacillus zhaodongensis]
MKALTNQDNQFVRFDQITYLAHFQGMSTAELAQKAGISHATLLGWRKRSPRASHLLAVAKVLGVSTDYLLKRTDDPFAHNSERKHGDGEATCAATFAHRLQVAMAAEGLNQSALAARAQALDVQGLSKISASTIYSYLHGGVQPKQYRLNLLAASLHVNAQWLLGYNVPMAATKQPVTNLLLSKVEALPIEKQKSLLALLD